MLNMLRQLDPLYLTAVMIFLQIGLVVIAAWLVQFSLRRSPRQQHFVWLAAIVAAAFSAPLHFLVPAWDIPVAVESNTSKSLNTGFDVNPTAAIEVDADVRSNQESQFAIGKPFDQPNNHERIAKTVSSVADPLLENGSGKNDATTMLEIQTTSASALPAVDWIQLALFAYIAIAMVFAFRLVVGWAQLRRLSGSPLESDSSLQVAREIAQQLDLEKLPRIIVSRSIGTPMAFGILQPTVALPDGFESWELETQHVVLAHELCHVERRDAVWDFAARIMSSVYWFHPAVHFAGRKLRQSREAATDVSVLDLGVSPTAYARELLRVATGQNISRSLPSMAMAGEQVVENRIKQILRGRATNGNRFSRSLTFKTLLLTSLVLLAGFSVRLTEARSLFESEKTELGLAGIQDQDSEKQENSKSSKAKPTSKPKPVTGDTFYKRLSQMQESDPREYAVDRDSLVLNINGTVFGASGEPARNAIVVLRDGRAMSSSGDSRINDILGKTTTDENGRYQLSNVKTHGRYYNTKIICVTSSGEFAHQSLSKFESDANVKMDLRLEKMVPVNGTLVNEEGNPVPDAKLEVAGFSKDISSVGTERIGLVDREMSPVVSTNEKGEFSFPELPPGQVVKINVKHPEYAYDRLLIRSTNDHPPFIYGNPRTEKLPVNDSGSLITIERGVEIGSRLVDDSGNPLSGIEIQVMAGVVKTSKDGSFQIKVKKEYLERKEFHIFIRDGAYGSVLRRVPKEVMTSKTSTITLSKPATLSGIVQDSDGNPIHEVGLHIDMENINYSYRTDVEGKFLIAKIPPGKIEFSLTGQIAGLQLKDEDGKRKYVRELTLELGETKQLEPIVVDRATPLRLHVEDEKGDPVAGARVQVLSPDGFSNLNPNSKWKTTAIDGSADLVTFIKPKSGSLIRAEFLVGERKYFGETTFNAAAEETKVTLRPSTTLSGIVTANGKPVPNVTIEVKSDGPTKMVRRKGFFVGQSTSYQAGTATTNDKGEYSIDVLDKIKGGQSGRYTCLLYTSPSPRDATLSRMPSSA